MLEVNISIRSCNTQLAYVQRACTTLGIDFSRTEKFRYDPSFDFVTNFMLEDALTSIWIPFQELTGKLVDWEIPFECFIHAEVDSGGECNAFAELLYF